MTPEQKHLYESVVKQFLYLRDHINKKLAEDPDFEKTEEYGIAGKSLLSIHELLEELKADTTKD